MRAHRFCFFRIGYAFAKEEIAKGKSVSENDIIDFFGDYKYRAKTAKSILHVAHNHRKKSTTLVKVNGWFVLTPTNKPRQ